MITSTTIIVIIVAPVITFIIDITVIMVNITIIIFTLINIIFCVIIDIVMTDVNRDTFVKIHIPVRVISAGIIIIIITIVYISKIQINTCIIREISFLIAKVSTIIFAMDIGNEYRLLILMCFFIITARLATLCGLKILFLQRV